MVVVLEEEGKDGSGQIGRIEGRKKKEKMGIVAKEVVKKEVERGGGSDAGGGGSWGVRRGRRCKRSKKSKRGKKTTE